MKLRTVSALAIAGASLLALPAHAVVTSTWTVETFSDFDAGDAQNAFITSLGEVRPGWDKKRVALEGDAVWSAVRAADGSVIVGSDEDGAIYRVSGDSAKKLGKIDGAIAVTALALDGSTLYAGAMPGSSLWKVDLATGKATAVAPLKGVESIWSLAVGKDGTLWAGTGPDGKLFAIKNGSAREVFATGDKRVTAVAVASDGAVWFGTSERALVFRHDPAKNETRAMADFAGNEISAIAELRGGVVVAANDLADPPAGAAKSAAAVAAAEKPGAAKGTPAKAPDTGTAPGADKDQPAVTDLGRRGARKGKGALFWIGGDGRLDQLHALTQTYFTSVVVGSDGAVYGGAADKGRIYRVDPDGSVATAFDVDERAVSHLWWEKDQLGFSTDDAAAIYHATGRASAATYVSDVFDAKVPSTFGALAWQAVGSLTIETRSGNTAKPGPGWSTWSSPGKGTTQGGGVVAGKIASPAGRYLQFRVAFKTDDAAVHRVVAYYVPQNQGTEVQDVAVEIAAKETTPTLKDSASKPRSPVLRLKWKIENPDSDDTSYKLEVRRDGVADWRTITTGKAPLTATTWEWNTETFPDGWYRVRVTSSDAGANSPDRALTSSATSALFLIDNQRPTIEGVNVSYPRATAKASDALSTIAEMSFSIDDGPWQLGTTADGLFDDLAETLRVDLPADLAPGSHTLSLRVADASGNVGSSTTTFVKK
ncbi:MAG: hypothetical protein K8W52_10710 [Deltaproteobacteria bacterium]|nr:hypothetical protein [Deltaproteobacteria bacterium]